MNLDVALLRDALLNEESSNLLTLVALKLDDLAKLLVINNGAVACKLLLEGLQELLLVIFLGNALESGKSLTSVPLLDTDVDVVLLLLLLLLLGSDLVVLLDLLVTEIGEGV